MNYGVISFLKQTATRDVPIQIYRSRPYRKNGNCYVEQKNFTHVRELFACDRIEDRNLVPLMNDIYRNYWNDLQNFFMPSMKLIRKTRMGARIKKEHDTAKTPYQRLLESSDKDSKEMTVLQEKYLALDPIDLQIGLESRLKEYLDLLQQDRQQAAA